MHEKAPHELHCLQSHEFLRVVVGGISPAKGYLTLIESDETTIRDSDAVSIAGQILEYSMRSVHRRPHLYHPIELLEGMQEAVKGFGPP
jgi:hypothetical protein